MLPSRVLRAALLATGLAFIPTVKVQSAGTEPHKVSGRVIACSSGDPVSLAVVNLYETGEMTLTGSDGSFSFILPAGAPKVHLAISHISFGEIPFMEIDSSTVFPVEVCLDEMVYEAPVIEVSAEAPRRRPTDSQAVEMDAADISDGALSQADPLYALKELAQVSSGSDFDGRFSINGSSPDANAFFLDGLYYPSPYHLGGLCSIYDASSIGTFRFSPSPLSSSAHGATGAVIEVESRDIGSTEDRSDFSLGLLSSSLSGARALGDGGTTISAMVRRSYIDLLYNAFGGAADVQMPNFYDIQAGVTRVFDGRRSVRLGMLLSGDQTQMSTEILSSGDGGASTLSWHRRIGALSLSYGYRRTDDSPWWGKAVLGVQPYRSTFQMGGNDLERMGWYGTRGTLRVDGGRRFGGSSITGGMFSSLSMIEYELCFGRGFWLASRNENSAVRLDNDGFAFTADGSDMWTYAGGYLEYGWEGEKTGVLAGTRVELFSRSSEVVIGPRVSIHRTIGDRTVLLASAGFSARDAAEDFGNPAAAGRQLRVEKAAQISAGIRRELPFGIIAQAGGHARRDWDLPVEVEPVTYASSGRGRGKGIDLGAEKTSGRWRAVAQYSWNDSERIDFPRTLTFRPDAGSQQVYNLAPAYDAPYWYPSPYGRKHSLTVEADRRMNAHLSLNIAWRIESGRPYTPIGEVFERQVGGYIASEGRRMSATLPAYSRLDIRAEWSWPGGACFIEVLNITNHPNVFNMRYNEDYSSRNLYRMIPLMPGFGFRMSF